VAESTPEPQKKKGSPPSTPRASRRKVPYWILQVRKLALLDIAEVLGHQVEDDRITPCPHCGDVAGAEVYRNKQGWKLWRCESCGTKDRGNLDLASYAIAGEKAGDLEVERKAMLRQWFADQGWCDGEGGDAD